MRRRICAIWFLTAFSLAPPAFGASENSPLDLYQAGSYEAAMEAGEADGTGAGFATAARAALAEANLRETPCLPCLQKAEQLARRSIERDPLQPEAFIYLAASLGYQSRVVGILRARFGSYPEKAKEAIDTALGLAPDDPWSLAAAGAWQIEVVRNGGSFLARTLYGARVETGRDYFRRAIAADPENLVIRVQYALSLSGYDFDENREEALSELSRAVKTEPRTAYETALRARALGLLELLNTERIAEFRAKVKQFQGYP